MIKKMIYCDIKYGWIVGVCVGIVEYFGFEVWLVCILMVMVFFLFVGLFVFVIYIVCWFIFDKCLVNVE